MSDTGSRITPEMTLLDIVERHEHAKEVFEKYDHVAGECILCYNLFEPLKTVISKYHLDEEKLLKELNSISS